MLVSEEAVVVHTLLQKELQIIEHPLLQLNSLERMLLINHAILAAPKVRLRHKMSILGRLAPHLDRQLVLARVSGRNLQEHDAEGEDIGRGACLQELHIHLFVLLIALSSVLII